jgi:AcrR family transcriptional regulator
MSGRRSADNLKEVIRDFRRDQVIEVARRLFGERGTTDVPMDEIAAQAGVSRSTVYVYFANRDELLRACLKGMHNQLLEDIAESWEDDAEPAHRLERLIEGMLERIDDDPAFFRLALTQGSSAVGGEAVGSELALIGLNIARLMRDLFIDGVSSGTFGDTDPDMAVNLIGQQIYGAMAVRPSPSSSTDWEPGAQARGRGPGYRARTARARCSASGDRRDDGQGLAIGYRGGQTVEEANVLVGEEDIDEPTEAAVFVEEAVTETGVGGVQRLQHLADR